MKVVYTGEEMPAKFSKSIFLAGPTPRNREEQKSWRPEALRILKDKGFTGTVFCPEGRDGQFKMNYDDQIGWEEKYLNVADCIVFWVPRDLEPDSKGYPKMAAFTTNVEFGTWQSSGKIVYGAPPAATKNGYLKHYAEQYNAPVADSLEGTLQNALDKLGDGAERSGGERFIPLFIWKQKSFQSWYQAQTGAGNRLDEARLLYSFRPRFGSFVFLWIVKAKVWIESEGRYKDNEFVMSRPDISSVLLWSPNPTVDEYGNEYEVGDSQVVLVREFRSPASTVDGFIRELPGGSAIGDGSPEEVAAEEVQEETGFVLDPSRIKSHGKRQLAGTFSAHQSHLFSAKLTDEEMKWFRSQKDIAYGNAEDSERTFIEVHNIHDLLEKEIVDWTTLGQILSVIASQTY
jgi:8-oxo-dGTP pyrophosphatase MutT (NUDIX family)